MQEPPAAERESPLPPWEMVFCVCFSGQMRKAHKNDSLLPLFSPMGEEEMPEPHQVKVVKSTYATT